jgi:hypothetical protein
MRVEQYLLNTSMENLLHRKRPAAVGPFGLKRAEAPLPYRKRAHHRGVIRDQRIMEDYARYETNTLPLVQGINR